MNIIKADAENISVTVNLLPHELRHFIDLYDQYAGERLRENDLKGAMRWVDRAKKVKEQRDIAMGKKSAEQE